MNFLITASSFSDIGATGILVFIAVIFGFFAVIKGVAKLIGLLIGVVLALVSGYFCYIYATDIFSKIGYDAQPWMHYALAVIGGIGTLFLVRTLFRFFVLTEDENGKHRFGFKAGIIGLLAGWAVVYCGMTGLRYADGVAQLEQLKAHYNGEQAQGKIEDLPFISKIREFFENSQVGRFITDADFLNNPERLNAVKKLLIGQFSEKEQAADTNNLKDALTRFPELQRAIEAQDVSSILNSDDVDELLADPKVKKAVEKVNLDSVYLKKINLGD